MTASRTGAALVGILTLVSAVAASEFTKGPYIQSLTATGVTVMWETEGPVHGAVEYGETDSLGHSVKPRGDAGLQAVRIRGLQSGRKYFYRVTAGDFRSPICSFTTLPTEGPFTFCVYGDTRTNPGDHETVVWLIEARKSAFVLHLGDLVEDGRDAARWWPEFFQPAVSLIAGTCVFTATGNHEYESELYYSYFGSHDGKPWYSFDCANAHFTMLDSCVPLYGGSEQYAWLEDDLASTKQRWKFVAFHHPLYSTGIHGNELTLRLALNPLFERYGVDLVFNGHEHDYERTVPIASKFGNNHPLVYVVSGGGGAPRFVPAGGYFTATKLSDLNYCVVAIDGDRLRFDAYDGHDRSIDNLEIVKSGDGYSNGYPGPTLPEELTEVEAIVGKALVDPETIPRNSGKSGLMFEFAAPAWSDLELDIAWRKWKWGKAEVTPARMSVNVPKGEKRVISASFEPGMIYNDVPSVRVRGKTALGDFEFDMRGVHFGKYSGASPPIKAEAQEQYIVKEGKGPKNIISDEP